MATSPPPHEFARSMAFADSYRDAGWWKPIYERAFPSLASAIAIKEDGWAQRGGIDRIITLASGKTIAVDEKIRAKDWPDVLLEVWSNEERRVPGWVRKPLACDFIAYAFAPSRVCYLLPVLPLQRAWRDNGGRWAARYGVIRARNSGYCSVSVPVPRDVLLRAIVEALVLSPAELQASPQGRLPLDSPNPEWA